MGLPRDASPAGSDPATSRVRVAVAEGDRLGAVSPQNFAFRGLRLAPSGHQGGVISRLPAREILQAPFYCVERKVIATEFVPGVNFGRRAVTGSIAVRFDRKVTARPTRDPRFHEINRSPSATRWPTRYRSAPTAF